MADNQLNIKNNDASGFPEILKYVPVFIIAVVLF